MRTTSVRVFHILLVRTIYGKRESPGAVGENDLIPLYSIIKGYLVNVDVLAAFGVRQQMFDECKSIFVSGLITRILKNLKLWPSNDR